MKKIAFTTLLSLLIFWGCGSSGEKNYNADLIYTESEKEELLASIIRYLGHLPPKATHETKFDPEYDAYYQDLVNKHTLEMVFTHPDDGHLYFVTTRQAPSLFDKRVATGGKLTVDGEGKLTFYEEVFRTWKLPEEDLAVKSSLLFQEMIDGNDLSIYYPENSGNEEVIEFPNAYTHYDVENRKWVSSRFDPSVEITP